MYSVSSQYLEAIRARTRTERLSGQVNFADGTVTTFTQNHLGPGGCTLTRKSVSGEVFEIGAIIASELVIHLNTKRDRFAFTNATLFLTYGIKDSGGIWRDVPLGTFYVYETRREGNGITITAYGPSTKLDKRYYGQVLTGTPHEIVTKICNFCGLSFAQTADSFSAFPNGSETIRIDSTSGYKTYWECLKQVMVVLGAFGYVNPNGYFSARRYAGSVTAELGNSNRYTLSPSDFVLRYSSVTVESVTGGVYTSTVSGASAVTSDKTAAVLGVGVLGKMILGNAGSSVKTSLELPLVISKAAAWNTGDNLQARTDALLAEISQLSYTPATWTMPGDPALEPGDRIRHTTGNGAFESLVTSYTWKFNGRMTVTGAGSNIALIVQQTKGNELPLKDYNGDGVIDMKDVDAFRELLVNGATTLEDDWNGDGEVDGLDVIDFRDLVLQTLKRFPNTTEAKEGQIVQVKSTDENSQVTEIETVDVPFGFQGQCRDANLSGPGTWRITGDSLHSPVEAGTLIVLGDADYPLVQLVFDDAGTIRKSRVVAAGSATAWTDL